jgi:hypothetical protein
MPFFWFWKVTVTYSVTYSRRGCVCGITRMRLSRKTRWRRQSVFVRPGVVGMQYSHERMAKKNAPMIMSTVWS